MYEIIKNRSEILFLYDVTDANPNGDPVEENRPRIDEETGQNIVTDVRLKRTVRDYLHDFKEEEILIREIRDENGLLQDAKMRAKDFLVNEEGEKLKKGRDIKAVQEMEQVIRQNVLRHCIDVRLFGVTLPFELEKNKAGSVITITGPVQFKLGRSLHRVEMTYIKGTGAFASQPGKEQFTFREEYILPYSLIAFYGIVNENAAQISQMTERDLKLLLDGLWNGTKNLISRTKAGQMPRLLLQVRYKEKNYHVGELDRRIKLVSNRRDEEIRDISEIQLDVTELARALRSNRDKIDKISYAVDERLSLVKNGNSIEVENLAEGIEYERLRF